MKFISIRDLRASTAKLRRDLKTDKEVIITANGRPFALLTPVEPDRVEEEIATYRSARMQAVLSRLHKQAKEKGLDKWTMDDIDALIARHRRERDQKRRARS
jgi:antitoxin (DNA-binding transcriptional repressor) of toxin-antitoxin stability system